MTMFIHFFCLCPLSLAIKLNFNISKVAYYSATIIYTSKLILCSTICVPSATRHNIHKHYVMLATQVYAPIAFLRREALALTKASPFPINSSILTKHVCQMPGGRPGIR